MFVYAAQVAFSLLFLSFKEVPLFMLHFIASFIFDCIARRTTNNERITSILCVSSGVCKAVTSMWTSLAAELIVLRRNSMLQVLIGLTPEVWKPLFGRGFIHESLTLGL